jgi:hypothetical protein
MIAGAVDEFAAVKRAHLRFAGNRDQVFSGQVIEDGYERYT